MKLRYALLPPLALAGASLALPSSAGAALTTRCVGATGGVAIPGDLVVPAGQSCSLAGVSIAGSVTVRAGADLTLADGSTVAGGVTVAADGFAEVIGSAVDGSVVARNPFTVVLDGTIVRGDVEIRANDQADGGLDATLFTIGAALEGAVTGQGAEVFLESTSILGDVTTRNGVLTDLHDVTVYGALRVQGNDEGSVVCASEIDGDAHFRANGYGLQLGGPGPSGSCQGPTYWGGSLVVERNVGDMIGIDVSNAIVRGSLAGTRNDPAPTASGNRVRGEVTGQFATATAAASAPAARTARASVDTRRPDADGAIAARRVAAAEQAATAETALLS